jgi:serine/threonine-protein kinase RsbW
MAARNQIGKADRTCPHTKEFETSLVGTAHAVRDALATCRAQFSLARVHPQKLDEIELVMAETLNNIVEHALAGKPTTERIQIFCKMHGDLVSIVFDDPGTPYAGKNLPCPERRSAAAQARVLPEGGFGWSLIHLLAKDITYVRADRRNLLTIVMDTRTPAHATAR